MIPTRCSIKTPATVVLTLGPGQKIMLDLGQGVVNARRMSDNKIQLKFRTKDFEGEYFHYDEDIALGSIIVPLHVNCRASWANAAMLKKAMINGAIVLAWNIDKAPCIPPVCSYSGYDRLYHRA